MVTSLTKHARRKRRCRLELERLEDRITPSSGPIDPFTLPDPADDFSEAHTIVLAGGLASQDGAINYSDDTDTFQFTATESGRVTVKMTALTQDLGSVLAAPGTPLFSEQQTPTLTPETLGDEIQFDVLAGQDYLIEAAGAASSIGFYTLDISTTADDVAADSYVMIPLDDSGYGTLTGTIDFAGDSDLFGFVSSLPGQVTVTVDGGVIPEQSVAFVVAQDQICAFSVFADGTATGSYNITISSVADDFPDETANLITVDDDGSAVQTGTVDYAGDVDVFQFKATQSGLMTLSMTTSGTGLQSSVTVPDVSIEHEFITSAFKTSYGEPSSNDILQFEVVEGQEYFVLATGVLGTQGNYIGNYTLSLAITTDDFSDSEPTTLTLDPLADSTPAFTASVHEQGSVKGHIEVQGDADLFEFTAGTTGWAIIQLDGTVGTDFHGMLTTSVTPLAVNADSEIGGRSALVGFINDAGQATLTTESNRDTFDPVLIIPVVAGETYQIRVSGDGVISGKSDDPTIGAYLLIVDTYSSDAVGEVTVDRAASDLHVDYFMALNVDFPGSGQDPQFHLFVLGLAPEFDVPPGQATDARLTLASLPVTVGPPSELPPPPVSVPGLGGDGSGNGEVSSTGLPGGPSTGLPGNSSTGLPGNSLVASLLSVAAYDNSLPGSTAAPSQGGSIVVMAANQPRPTLARDNSAGSGGSEESRSISGTVFDDVNGDGVMEADEPGMPGVTVVLERVEEGKSVPVATTTTDENGHYCFNNVPPGEYHVKLEHKTGTLAQPTSFLVRARPRREVPQMEARLQPRDLAEDQADLAEPLAGIDEFTSLDTLETARIRGLLFLALGAPLWQDRKRAA